MVWILLFSWQSPDAIIVQPETGFIPCDNPELFGVFFFFALLFFERNINELDDQFCNLQLPSSFEAI